MDKNQRTLQVIQKRSQLSVEAQQWLNLRIYVFRPGVSAASYSKRNRRRLGPEALEKGSKTGVLLGELRVRSCN